MSTTAISARWLGGKTVEDCKAFLALNNIKVRAGSQGIMDTAKMTFEMRPIIEAKTPLNPRRWLPFDFGGGPWFANHAERDAVLAAITA